MFDLLQKMDDVINILPFGDYSALENMANDFLKLPESIISRIQPDTILKTDKGEEFEINVDADIINKVEYGQFIGKFFHVQRFKIIFDIFSKVQ